MRVTLLQHDLVWKDPEANVRRFDLAIDRNPGSDVYVFPEMFSTGFITQPRGCAETDDSETLRWMIRKSRQADAALAGSVAVESNGRYYNRFYFVKPDGEVVTYDKSHLFVYGGEGLYYSAGSERVITEFRGVRILLEICYDLRFPMWCRNQIGTDGKAVYDMIIYCAEWPLARKLAWDTLIRARAIENQCFVAACNRVGKDDWGEYFGGSALVHPYGHLLTEEEESGSECELTGEIDMEQLERYRTKFPTLNDILWKKDYC